MGDSANSTGPGGEDEQLAAPGGGRLILIVEDDPDVARLVRLQLERSGFMAAVNATGEGLLAQVLELRPALLILDLMLPAGSGLLLLRQLRQHPATAALPAIILTALDGEAVRLKGFALGASDYVTKPFSPRELAARVQARLREGASGGEVISRGRIRLDLRERTAFLAGAGGEKALRLSATEYRILAYMLRHAGRALTRQEILDAGWAPQHAISERTVDVYMLRLRSKLAAAGEPGGNLLVAVRGVGYRLDAAGRVRRAGAGAMG